MRLVDSMTVCQYTVIYYETGGQHDCMSVSRYILMRKMDNVTVYRYVL